MSAGARPVTLLSNMDRRTLLRAITVGVIAATIGSPRAHADPVRWGVSAYRVPAPDPVLIGLPGGGNQLALTIETVPASRW